MVIDGKKIADHLKERLKTRLQESVPSLIVFVVGGDQATESFLKIKARVGQELGVRVEVKRFSETVTQDTLLYEMHILLPQYDGVIVQLPLPKHIDTDAVIAAIPPEKDVDALGAQAGVLSPVVGAMKEILNRSAVQVHGKKVVVIGKGRLVGAPAAAWLMHEGADVVVLDKSSDDIGSETQRADIIVLGAGSPHLLKPDMIKEDVVILDAGTSEAGGKLVGDADPACAAQASIFTPVPGGIGPIAVVKIFENLYALT